MSDELDEDLDDAGGDDGGSGKSGSSKLKKLLLLVVLPLMLIIAATAGAFVSGLADPLLAMFTGKGDAAKGGDAGPVVIYHDLPEMLVNLNTGGKKKSYLKIRVALELGSLEDQKKLEVVLPRIVDTFQVFLRELRVEDLQGSAGMYRLHEEMLIRAGTAAKPIKINDVLFREMLVQ